MDEYTYTELVTIITLTDKKGNTYTEEWCGCLDLETTDFAQQKLLADYDLDESDVKSFSVSEQEVERNTGWPASELYGGGNCWSASGDYFGNSDWSASLLYR